MRYDIAELPAYYESAGSWQLRDGHYVVAIKSWSASVYKDTVGKTYKVDVLEVNKQIFRYVSPDNADEEERRIGEASDRVFEVTRLEPLLPNGYESAASFEKAIRNAKKAQPVVP